MHPEGTTGHLTGTNQEHLRFDACRRLIVFTILAIFLIAALWPTFHSAAMPMDEGMVLVYPEMILKGHLPYRDFESITGPGNPLILASAYAIFGTNIFVERAVGLLYRIIALLAVFGITQRWGTLIAAGCSFATVVLLGSADVMAYTWLSGISFALCSFWAMANVASGWRCFAAGVLAGVSFLGRCDFGLALIVSSLPLFLSMKQGEKLKFLAGGLLAVSPLIWITIAVGPSEIVHSLFFFPVFQLNPGRHLPIAEANSEMIRLLGFQIIASLMNIAAGIFELRNPATRARGRLLLGVGLLGLGFIHYALQRFDYGHTLHAAFVALSFLPLSIFLLLAQVAKAIPRRTLAVAAIFISMLPMHLLLPGFTRYFYRGLRVTAGITPPRHPFKNGDSLEAGDEGVFITHNGRPFPFGFPYAADDADKLLTELERVSLPGQRLFVGPGDLRLTNYCDTYIYYMEPQLTPATYFLEMNPGSANAPNSRLSRDVASADWVILNRRWDFLNESNRSIHLGASDPNQTVRQDFDFWSQSGSFLLFRNKKLRNAIVPQPR
jgi:hypothetical protein